MSVLLIAGCGMAAVLVCILVLRMHPLLALLIGSLLLLVLTPDVLRLENELGKSAVTVEVSLRQGALIGLKQLPPPGKMLLWPAQDIPSFSVPLQLVPADQSEANAVAEINRVEGGGGAGGEKNDGVKLYWFTVIADGELLPQVKDRLISEKLAVGVMGARWSSLGGRLSEGLASTFRKLGVPVTMAAIVGACLLESGAAARIVAAIIGFVGHSRTAPALTFSGFLLGVPVYFDNVFYLLLPLAKAVGRQRPEMYLTAVMAIIVGATMAHSLVPPTPGPLFVASELNVNVGTMMIGGIIVGGIAASAGFTYGLLCKRWVQISVPEVLADSESGESVGDNLPLPLWLAAMPIAFPIGCLGGSEIVKYYASVNASFAASMPEAGWLVVFSDPALVFIFSAVMSIAILRRGSSASRVSQTIAKGLGDAGVIVLLTCAGGAFGASLKELHIAEALGSQFNSVASPWGILFTAFTLTAVIRAAQGSATVAMLTSSAIVGPAIATIELPFHPLYVAMAIGCGSKPLPWMNDSGFWQVATMTGMTTSQTLKTFTVALTLMGIVGFAVTLLGAWILPLS
jgi:gluconate:H+ symporter, GntP family